MNYYKPGPITTRPMTEDEREYFRKRQEQLRKENKVLKKPAQYEMPGHLDRYKS